MDSYKIQMLLATIQTGSFSKAADKCSCSQPAITQAMNTLEAELDVKLLDRSHRGVKLTEDGEKLLPFILDADQAMRNVLTEAKRLTKKTDNVIRIGSFVSIANTWLPPLLKTFKELHPEVEYEMMIATNDLEQFMRQGMTDISFTDNLRNKSFRFHPLAEEEMSFVVNLDTYDGPLDEIPVEDIKNYPFIMITNDIKEHLIDINPTSCTPLMSDSDDVAVHMVVQGLGTTIVPNLSMPDDIPENVVIVPTKPQITRTVGMAVPNKPSAMTQELVKFILKTYRPK